MNGAAYAGGLAGYSTVSISNSSATGAVTGSQYTGGLVGWNYGSITNSNSGTAAITGAAGSVGGLVGYNTGSITSSTAGSGQVSGPYAGGAVGANGAPQNSFGSWPELLSQVTSSETVVGGLGVWRVGLG